MYLSLLYLAALAAAPKITVNAGFEAGNIGKVEILSENHVRCAVNGERDQDGRNRQPSWFYFRLDGAAGREVTIDLTDLHGEYNYRPHDGYGLRNTRPAYSYDDRTWQAFDASEFDRQTSTLRVRLKAAHDRVWIARQPPYTTRHLQALLASFRGNPALRQEEVGKTVGGRPMVLLTVTNPKVPDAGKKVIWLMARHHAWESGTSWAAEGALRFLLSSDAQAARIRDQFIFKIFPIGDPDGVVRGGVRFNANGYDLNRNWDAFDPKLAPEIAGQRRAMMAWLDAGRPIHFFLTLHNTESADFIEGPLTAGGPAVRELGERLSKLLADTTTFYAPKGARDGRATTTAGMKGRMSVNQALFAERKVPAFLMELMVDSSPKLGRPPGVPDRLEFGAALVRAMCAAVR